MDVSDSEESDYLNQEDNDYDIQRYDWEQQDREREQQRQQQEEVENVGSNGENVPIRNFISPWNKELEGVSTLHKCEATNASCLYIFDSDYKLKQSDQYDIGGAYIENNAAFWFFFTTSAGLGRIYLMNIFVCQRKPGKFALGISDSNILTTITYNDEKVKTLSSQLHWQNLNSIQQDEIKYIKTFQFSEEDRVSLEKMVLIIPISISMSSECSLVKDIVQKIKNEFDFGETLFEDQERNFILMSKEGKEFRVHKIALAAHSHKLRDLIRAEDCKSVKLDITDKEVELLLQYLYTGFIKNISQQPLDELLMIADTFQLDNLKQLVYHSMKISINSENALSIAVISEKYNFSDLQEVAFKYVAENPNLLESKAFSEINNADVVKKLTRYINDKAK